MARNPFSDIFGADLGTPTPPAAPPASGTTINRDPGVVGGAINWLLGSRESRHPEYMKDLKNEREAEASNRVYQAIAQRVQNGMTPQAALLDYIKSPQGADAFAMDNGAMMKGVQTYIASLNPEQKTVNAGDTLTERNPVTGKTTPILTADKFVAAPVLDEQGRTIGSIIYNQTNAQIVSGPPGTVGKTYDPNTGRVSTPGTPALPPAAPPARPVVPGQQPAAPGGPRTAAPPPPGMPQFTGGPEDLSNARNWAKASLPKEQYDALMARLKADPEYRKANEVGDTKTAMDIFQKHAQAVVGPPNTGTPGQPPAAPPQAPGQPGFIPNRVQSPARPVDDRGVKTLWGQVKGITGAVPSTLDFTQRIVGQFGMDVTSPEFRQGRAAFNTASQNLITAVATNKRYATSEQEHIRKNIDFGPSFWKDERTMYDQLINMDNYAAGWVSKLEQEYQDSRTPQDRKKDIAVAIADWRRFRDSLGVPPVGHPDRENPPVSTFKDVKKSVKDAIDKSKKGARNIREGENPTDSGAPPGAPGSKPLDQMSVDEMLKLPGITPAQKARLEALKKRMQQ